jgi:hypothetical protein
VTWIEIIQQELQKTTFLQDRYDYSCEHICTKGGNRKEYNDSLWNQFKEAKIHVGEHNLKLAAIESFQTGIIRDGEKVQLYFKIIK